MRDFKHGAPKKLTTALSTTEPFHLWANGSTGDDANPGTEAAPKKTIAALFATLPAVCRGDVAFHLRGTFTVQDPIPVPPGTPSWDQVKSNNTILGKLIFDGGDEVTQVAGPFTADISSTTTIGTTGSGWTVDQWQGKWVRILDGPAAGEIRTIGSSTADTLYIMGAVRKQFGANPGSCQYDIVRPATTLQARPGEWTDWSLDFSRNTWVFLQRLYFTASDPSRIFNEQLWLLFQNSSYEFHACMFEGATALQCLSNVGVRAWFWFGGTFPDIDLDFAWDNNYRPCSIVSVGTSYIDLYCLGAVFGSRGLLFAPGSTEDRVTIADSEIFSLGGCLYKSTADMNNCTASFYNPIWSYEDKALITGAPGVGLTLRNSSIRILTVAAWTEDFEVSNCGSHAIELRNSTLELDGAILGSGNAGAGVYAHSGSKLIVANGAPSTITGTVGDLAVSDPTVEESTWANLDAAKALRVEAEDFYARTDVSGAVPAVSYARQTTEVLHVYVDGDSGDDANGGTSWADAVKTMGALDLPYIVNHNLIIHCRGTIAGNWGLSFTFGDAWQASIILDGGADQTEVVADDTGSPWTADIATTSTIGKTGAGWTVDAYTGYWVEILSGPYAGITRQIQGNTADTLTVTYNWAGAPSGAQFRVIQPKTYINGSTNIDVAGAGYVYIQNLRWGPNEPPYTSGTGIFIFTKVVFVAGWGWYPTAGSVVIVNTWGLDADTLSFLYGAAFPNMGLTVFDPNGYGSYLDNIDARLTSIVVPGYFYVANPYQFRVYTGSRIGHLYLEGVIGRSQITSTRLGGPALSYGLFATSGSYCRLVNCDISNCSGAALDISLGSTIRMNATTGSNNGKACHPHDSATVLLDAQPTLSGTVDGVTLDGTTTADTWANIYGGTPLVDTARGVLVRKREF